MTEDQVRQMLFMKFERRGDQFAWAKKHGISQAYVSQFLSGKRGIGPQILEALDLEAFYHLKQKGACGQARKGA